MYEEVYDGIDLKYYSRAGMMEFDFILEPGANYSQIRICFDGIDQLSVNQEGGLDIRNDWGGLSWQAPVACP